MAKKIALFPGSFDPFTKGHEDIVLRGLRLFDEIIIAIGYNREKSARYFPIERMIKYIQATFADSPADIPVKKYLRTKFKVVKAAGGLVRKKEKFLMIYRMKKWDLPKGKREKSEGYRETAVREVGEECNISVKIGKKICTTWHTYTMNKRAMLKKTKWYMMDCVDDAKMKPALEEDIEELRWMTRKEVYHALEHSYKSISYVFERYYKETELKSAQ